MDLANLARVNELLAERDELFSDYKAVQDDESPLSSYEIQDDNGRYLGSKFSRSTILTLLQDRILAVEAAMAGKGLQFFGVFYGMTYLEANGWVPSELLG